jgi:dTDP-4-amino-4,6-dideoxygalactose transaminase
MLGEQGILPGIGGSGASTASPLIGHSGIPLARLDNADPYLVEELMLAVERVAYSGEFTLGEEVEGFEQEFADYCGAGFAVGVSSGTDALALALLALGVRPGDEVILPANAFISTADAVMLAGARPQLVDVDPDTQLLTAEIVERHLTPRTRCVIVVHLYGRTADLDPIVELARARGLAVVEDACQAHGALYRGRRVGTVGDCGCFSFHPTTNLGGWGDGGAVVTNDRTVARFVRLHRSQGEDQDLRPRSWGTPARLQALQAAVLRAKLPYLDGWNRERRRVAAEFTDSLRGTQVRPPAPVDPEGDHVFQLYVVTSSRRERLRAHLAERGIATGVHYPLPLHLTDAYAHLGLPRGSFPVSERLAATICSLPVFPGITRFEAGLVARALREFAADPGQLELSTPR